MTTSGGVTGTDDDRRLPALAVPAGAESSPGSRAKARPMTSAILLLDGVPGGETARQGETLADRMHGQ